jgi:small subunit ribosomal protein S20
VTEVGAQAAVLLALPSRFNVDFDLQEGTSVANIKSQKKRILTNAKRAERNKAVKSELKTRVKNAVKAAETEQSEEALRLAVKRLDMAAAKGVIHKNQAARRKSRLMKQINASAASAS